MDFSKNCETKFSQKEHIKIRSSKWKSKVKTAHSRKRKVKHETHNSETSTDTDSSSESSMSSLDKHKKKYKSSKKMLKRKRKKSDSDCSSESFRKQKCKKQHKKKSKRKKKKSKLHISKEENIVNKAPEKDCQKQSDVEIGPLPPEAAKAMAPMTKEEWEKKQSVIRRVYDPETGRNRLVKGDGEILEEIVSRERHKEINKVATLNDGEYFKKKMGLNL